MKTVIFDIDGTLANIDVRRKYLEQEPKDWKSFNSKLETDIPNHDICELARMYGGRGYYIIICTGRFEAVRAKTEHQLIDWGIFYNSIYMRPDGDFKPDNEIKNIMLNTIKSKGLDIQIAVDDRDQVVKMWRDNGIRCLQVAEGNF